MNSLILEHPETVACIVSLYLILLPILWVILALNKEFFSLSLRKFMCLKIFLPLVMLGLWEAYYVLKGIS